MKANGTAGSEVKTIPRVDTEDFSASVAGWKTTLFNCNCHTFAEVINQLMKAVGCPLAEASQLASTVHETGSAVVYRGTKPDCDRIAASLSSIGLVVDVSW